MSKKIYLFSLVLLALAFVSCSETEEEGKFANWRARNEAFLDSLQQVYDAMLMQIPLHVVSWILFI